MEKRGKTATQDNAQRVRIPWFPKYRELRHLLSVWPGHSKTQITGLQQTLMGLTGTPQNQVDWKDPDMWIPERLSGEDRKLAYAIWTKSGKAVNPRHTAGHWILSERYELVSESSNGNLELTERGREFVDQPFGKAELLLDQQEGLIELLTIVADAGPARAGVLAEPWAEFLERASPFGSSTTIRDTLRRRLNNLVDRDFVTRKQLKYPVTKDGLDYLKRAAVTDRTSKVPNGIRRYAGNDAGRVILNVFADSTQLANAVNPACWATLIPDSSPDLRLFVGPSILMVLREPSMSVEITLMTAQLDADLRKRLQPNRVGRHYKRPEGAARYQLDPKEFVERWPGLQEAHRKAIAQAAAPVQKTLRWPEHRVDAIDFLNRTLSCKLTQPGYIDDGGTDPSTGGASAVKSGVFGRLTRSLRKEGLLFSPELVANYILALQTKRFAILTGISGTGKTKIAKAVAQHFQPLRRRKVAKIPDDAVEARVKPSHLKFSKMVLPIAISRDLDIETSGSPGTGPPIWVRYPAGRIKLGTYLANGKYPVLRFKGNFRAWFQSSLKLDDSFWLRVHPGETDESEELEIGLSEIHAVEERGDNYVVIPVRPDWVDNRGLLGYLNPLTDEYSTTPFLNLLLRAQEEEKRAGAAGEKPHPFFVILDEMNLARVEHYFSDFLSALESGEDIPLHEDGAIESGESESEPQIPRRLMVPGNVFFTGTVNVDETTYMFSPKVLDRAFTIEFDQVDLEGFTKGENSDDASGLNLDGGQGSLDLLPPSSSGGDDWRPSREDWVKFSEDSDGHQKALLKLHGLLEARHRHFGYRVANEIARFVNLAREQALDADKASDAAFDLALLQKILPKFHGTQQELESLLKEILHFTVHGGDQGPKGNKSVELDDWKVVAGRLTARAKPPTSFGDGDAEAAEPGSDDAELPPTPAHPPAYPRTGAKVLRMLQRLKDRGFTSFIE